MEPNGIPFYCDDNDIGAGCGGDSSHACIAVTPHRGVTCPGGKSLDFARAAQARWAWVRKKQARPASGKNPTDLPGLPKLFELGCVKCNLQSF